MKHLDEFERLFSQAIDVDKEKEQKESSQLPSKSAAKTVKVIEWACDELELRVANKRPLS